jgi:hypothetical protein
VTVTDGDSIYVSPLVLLKVLFRATITQQPTPPAAIVPEGGTASFTVGADGSFPIAYRWRKSSATIPGMHLFLDAYFSTLILTNIQGDDGRYSYDVIVTNQVGIAGSSQKMYLTVVTNQPASQISRPGGTATFQVGAAGLQPRFYQWQFNGQALTNQTNLTLVLGDVQRANLGPYTVQVTTSNATYTTPPAWLTFNPVVRRPQLTGNGDFSLELTGGDGAAYLVEASVDLTNWVTAATFTQTNVQTTVVVPKAPEFTNRFFRVRLQE